MESYIVPGSVIDMIMHGMTIGGRESVGGGGGNITQILQQQMWGPSFSIGSDSTVHLLTTNYKNGQSGYWARKCIGVEDTFSGIDYSIIGMGGLLPDCTIIPIFKKVWVTNESSLWNNLKNGLLSFLNWTESRDSGFVFNDGSMSSGFTGGNIGEKGCLYGVRQSPLYPGAEVNNLILQIG